MRGAPEGRAVRPSRGNGFHSQEAHAHVIARHRRTIADHSGGAGPFPRRRRGVHPGQAPLSRSARGGNVSRNSGTRLCQGVPAHLRALPGTAGRGTRGDVPVEPAGCVPRISSRSADHAGEPVLAPSADRDGDRRRVRHRRAVPRRHALWADTAICGDLSRRSSSRTRSGRPGAPGSGANWFLFPAGTGAIPAPLADGTRVPRGEDTADASAAGRAHDHACPATSAGCSSGVAYSWCGALPVGARSLGADCSTGATGLFTASGPGRHRAVRRVPGPSGSGGRGE